MDDLREKIAAIIQDAGEDGCEHGPAYDAAGAILALTEIAEALAMREQSWAGRADDPRIALGHAIKVRPEQEQ